MSQLLYESISVGLLTVLIGNVTACVMDFLILSPRLKLKLPIVSRSDKFYQMGILLFLTGVFAHLICELIGINKWYCKKGYACNRK